MRLLCLRAPLHTLVLAAVLYLDAPTSAPAQAPYHYASIPSGGATSYVAAFSVNSLRP